MNKPQVRSDFVIHRTFEVEDIIDLRHSVLRAGLPLETAYFEGDYDARTLHFVVFLSGQPRGMRAVSCASFMFSSWEGTPAYQLRGMATAPDCQGRGLGKKLLEVAEEKIKISTRLLWCNARLSAATFYERQGWIAVSDVFEIPTAGPHRKMTKKL